MGQRQVRFFKLGCWAAAITAAVHLVGYVTGPPPPANETEQMLTDMATSYQFSLPGGVRRTLMDIMDGFSLSFALFMATIGGIGFLVLKRGRDDAILMTALARALAGFSLVLLVISLTHWFIIPTLFIASVALCFVLATMGRAKSTYQNHM
jgi:hypothetical protein